MKTEFTDVSETRKTITIEITRYFRAPSFRKVERAGRAGRGSSTAVTSSSGLRAVRRLPRTNSPSGSVRVPAHGSHDGQRGAGP